MSVKCLNTGRFTREQMLGNTNGFKKGLTPWNKGTKGLTVAWNKGKPHPVAALNPQVFKKGHSAWNKGNKNYLAGDKHYNWKGGITPLHNKIRGMTESRIWREHVFQRDWYTCQDCKNSSCKLSADHIVPFSIILQTYKIKSVEDALTCDFLWDIRNGRTLCEPCHKNTPTYAGKMQTFKKSNL